jgi:hypothetical protein
MVQAWLTRRLSWREKSDADPVAAGRRVGHNSTMTYAPRAEKRTDTRIDSPDPVPDSHSQLDVGAEVVIYDKAQPTAWVQSNCAVDPEAQR